MAAPGSRRPPMSRVRATECPAPGMVEKVWALPAATRLPARQPVGAMVGAGVGAAVAVGEAVPNGVAVADGSPVGADGNGLGVVLQAATVRTSARSARTRRPFIGASLS